MKLEYAVLLAADLERLRGFYVDTLGLPVRSETPSWIELGSPGTAILALRSRDRPYDGDAGDGAGAQVAFKVPLEALAGHEARLRGQGVEIVEPVTRNHGSGHTTLFVLDPERNVVELYAEHQAPAGAFPPGPAQR